MAPEETRTTSGAPPARRRQHLDQLADPGGVDAAGGGGQRRRAGLDHDPAGADRTARSPPAVMSELTGPVPVGVVLELPIS